MPSCLRRVRFSARVGVLLAVALVGAEPTQFQGRVVGISDGDTIRVLQQEGPRKAEVKIRLHGIDSPEKGQPFGSTAKQTTSDLVFDQVVTVIVMDTDRYGRTVAEVLYDGGKSLNRKLVSEGMAWWFRRYAPDDQELAALEKQAREERRGLWRDKNPTPPWEWRAAERARDRR